VSRDWTLFLADAIAFCEKTIEYTAGLTREEFERDSRTWDATMRNLELLGEAAKRVPDSIRMEYLDVPWRRVAGLRDILAHTYFGVDNDIIWDIVTNQVGPVLADLRALQDRFGRPAD
jgi:uncharacterized protein with HEPN domain